MTSSSNLLSIVFHSYGETSEPGFSATYTAIESKDGTYAIVVVIMKLDFAI